MAYKHHHELSVTITLIALAALLLTVRMDLDTSTIAVGIFILYWILSSIYFRYFQPRIEERIFLMVTGTIFLFLFISLIAFLSQVNIATIILGIVLSITILLFPMSHSLLPSHELRRLSEMPEVKHKYFMPFSSCYRVDVEFPSSLYIRDVIGSDEMEFSFYLKHPPKTYKIIESHLVKGISAEGNRVSLEIDRKIIGARPRMVLRLVQKIAREL